METRRPTREEIADKAKDHVAYGWARMPGTHRRDIEWTDEDTALYNEEYAKELARTRAHRAGPPVTPRED